MSLNSRVGEPFCCYVILSGAYGLHVSLEVNFFVPVNPEVSDALGRLTLS